MSETGSIGPSVAAKVRALKRVIGLYARDGGGLHEPPVRPSLKGIFGSVLTWVLTKPTEMTLHVGIGASTLGPTGLVGVLADGIYLGSQ